MTDRPLIEVRLRSRVGESELNEKVGKILTADDYNLTPTNDCAIRKPDGTLLCLYRRGIIPPELREESRTVLRELQSHGTFNRGLAGGSQRVPSGSGRFSEGKRVPSAVAGALETRKVKVGARYCRLTAWTAAEPEKWGRVHPLLRFIAGRFEEDVPDRYANQIREAQRTHPAWVIPDTPFTTITVNNTYPTGVHKDAGDLDAGFSALAVLRTGDYQGAALVFPEYRVGVDMQDGDLLLMDAHEWHGNIPFDPAPTYTRTGRRTDSHEFERISIVSYFRTNMVSCGSPTDEAERVKTILETRAASRLGE